MAFFTSAVDRLAWMHVAYGWDSSFDRAQSYYDRMEPEEDADLDRASEEAEEALDFDLVTKALRSEGWNPTVEKRPKVDLDSSRDSVKADCYTTLQITVKGMLLDVELSGEYTLDVGADEDGPYANSSSKVECYVSTQDGDTVWEGKDEDAKGLVKGLLRALKAFEK